MLSGRGPENWQRIAKVVGRVDWLDDARFASTEVRDSKRDALVSDELLKWFSGHSVRECVDLMSSYGVPIAAVNNIAQAADDPHPWERDLLMEVADPVAGNIHVSGNIMHYSRSGLNIGPAPLPGEHTEEVLKGLLGMTDGEIATLRDVKAI